MKNITRKCNFFQPCETVNCNWKICCNFEFLGNDGYTYGGMNDASLVMRFITDMYYYDYIHDFVFHQNGAIEIKTILTGVLFMTPYYPKN